MGVSGGDFLPSPDYDPAKHARFLEGVEMPSCPELHLRTAVGVELEIERASVWDWTDTCGERELEVFGIDAQAFFGPIPDLD